MQCAGIEVQGMGGCKSYLIGWISYRVGTQTHLSWVAEIFGLILLIHGDDASNIFCFYQLQHNKEEIGLKTNDTFH